MNRRLAIRSIGLGLLGNLASGALRACPRDAPAPLRVRVDDEFDRLRAAVVHDASNARDLDGEELLEARMVAEDRGQCHPEAGPVSGEAVVREVAGLRKLLARFRVEIIDPVPIEGAASQVFTRDPLFVVGKTAFLGSLLDDHRVIEMEGLAEIRERLPRVVDLAAEGAAIEGGDVMVLDGGKTVLVGINANTNEAGSASLAAALEGTGTRVVRVRHRRLHLDCCLAPLPDGSALYHARGLGHGSLPGLKKLFRTLIPLDTEEAYRSLAANLLWIDRKNVVSGTLAVKTNERLRSLGYTVHPLDFNTVKRMWGSFRCAVCPIHRG